MKKKKPITNAHIDGIIYPTKDVITAKHWLPEYKCVWDQAGDLRARIWLEIESVNNGKWIGDAIPLCIEDAVVMDPQKPYPVKVIGANWIHADVHGVLTEDIFFDDLSKGIAEFADMIVTEQNPFRPVRIYKDAEPAYGVGYFDWRGDVFPFDIRTLCQFGQWEFTTDKNETVVAAGFRFWIGTLVLPTKDDTDVIVGRDMAKLIDAI